MRKILTAGAVAFMGLVAPAGAFATAAGTAASTATTAAPVLYHVPLLGKQLLSVSLHGLKHTANVQSANWAGYAATGLGSGGDTFQTLSSSWIEPTATCNVSSGGILGLGASKAADASFWVGLDGYSSKSVEQTGSDSDCASNGTPVYYAWYEMYPAGSVDLSPTQYPVSPGDTMTAMVMSNGAGTQFNLAIKDATKGWIFSIPETGSGLARSSAEVVAEAPSQCSILFCRELPLANFGTVTFTNVAIADTTGHAGTMSAYSNADMQMALNGTVKATPSNLSPNGSSFSVTWQHP